MLKKNNSSEMSKNKHSKLYAGLFIFILAVSAAFVGSYAVADNTVATALNSVTITMGSINLPENAWGQGQIIIRNPSNIDLDSDINVTFFISPNATQSVSYEIGWSSAQINLLKLNGWWGVSAHIRAFSEDAINLLHSGNYSITFSAKIKASGSYLLWQITKERTVGNR